MNRIVRRSSLGHITLADTKSIAIRRIHFCIVKCVDEVSLMLIGNRIFLANISTIAGFKAKSRLENHRSYHFDPKIPCKICEKLFRNK